MKRTILFFIDGLGWSPDAGSDQPLQSYGGDLFRLPALAGPDAIARPRGGFARPIDAVLGIDGVPQSATGQTTLLSGVNAQAVLGKHLTGFPNDALREVLLQNSILKRFTDRGMRARFLNAFRPRFWDFPRERQLRMSATTVANLAADLPFFTVEDIARGHSIYQDFTNEDLIGRGFELEPMTPEQAGGILAAESAKNDFTLYEYFLSDKAGHTGNHAEIVKVLALLDRFLGALLDGLEQDSGCGTLVVVTSDHGNLEDAATRRHTTNPVPLMAWGKGAKDLVTSVESLDQVAGAIIDRHGARSG